ncbi:MAG: S1C family serine protease, partial [Planctomycetota bacterium]
GASAGVGFSIPVDIVNKVVPEIIRRGNIEPPRLGIWNTEENNERLKQLTGVDGVAILQLQKGGAAERAGLKPFVVTSRGIVEGDIIQKIDDQRVSTFRELQEVMFNYRRGDKVKVTFYRREKLFEVDVELD